MTALSIERHMGLRASAFTAGRDAPAPPLAVDKDAHCDLTTTPDIQREGALVIVKESRFSSVQSHC
jgi:hypothetical protein